MGRTSIRVWVDSSTAGGSLTSAPTVPGSLLIWLRLRMCDLDSLHHRALLVFFGRLDRLELAGLGIAPNFSCCHSELQVVIPRAARVRYSVRGRRCPARGRTSGRIADGRGSASR